MAMQDVEKTNIQRLNSAKRLRRRKRMVPLYMLLVLILVVGVGVSLSVTVFFNVKTFRVEGDAQQYSAREIVDATGIQCGDNMVRLNAAAAEKKILDQMIYVESVDIQKNYPGELVINVKRCQESFNISSQEGVLITSASGKILSDEAQPMANIPVIEGYEPAERTPGQMLTSADTHKDKIFQILSSMRADGSFANITSVNMTDKYNIVIWFDNRIEFDMGNWSEMEYKIQLAETVIDQLGEEKTGVLSMVGSNQCSFRDRENMEAADAKAQERKAQRRKAEEQDESDDSESEDTDPFGYE